MFASNTSQVSSDANWIEECFQSYLYTGNGTSQSINNGIDLAGKGGLVWVKPRNLADSHELVDTVRGADKVLQTNNTDATWNNAYSVSGFSSTGFTYNNGYGAGVPNYVSWTFRKQPKFFDVVTYTGDGSASGQTISHTLGSTPGCIIVKAYTGAAGPSWNVYHRNLSASYMLYLNSTSAASDRSGFGDYISNVTSTSFKVNSNSAELNGSGRSYIAYVFAHNAGGFGLTGTDNVISCGSFTYSGSTVSVNLGYEPQWLLVKTSSTTGDWQLFDNMRGMPVDGVDAMLRPNLSNAEVATDDRIQINATGFTATVNLGSSPDAFIYIAIRRGPMKTPTSGTSVFAPVAVNNATSTLNTINFPLDLQIAKVKDTASNICVADRLRGVATTDTLINNPLLITSSTSAELTDDITRGVNNVGFLTALPFNSTNAIYWNFRRAPGFFDEVCYTGTAATNAQTHNLGVAPELVITKSRSGAFAWSAYVPSLNINIRVDSTAAGTASGGQVSVSSTAVTYSAAAGNTWNGSGNTYVAYLFASCPGVSKVGSYTGNGSSQTINCGFTGGARFVMIKRTDSTGDWYVWDTARGIVSANDPRLSLNTTAAEVTTDDSIDPDNSGFIVNQVTATNINVSSATYIYLAIA